MNGCDAFAECCGAAIQVLRRMGWGVRDQRLSGGVGPSGWVWIRWVGEHDKLHTPD